MEPHAPIPSLLDCAEALARAKDLSLCRCALEFQTVFDADARIVEIRAWLDRSPDGRQIQTEILLSAQPDDPGSETYSAFCVLEALDCSVDPQLADDELQRALVLASQELDDERGGALMSVQSDYRFVKSAFRDIDPQRLRDARERARLAHQAIRAHALLPECQTETSIYPVLTQLHRQDAPSLLRSFWRSDLAALLEASLIAENTSEGPDGAHRQRHGL